MHGTQPEARYNGVYTVHKKLVSDSGVLQQLTKVPAVKLAAAHVLDPTAAALARMPSGMTVYS